LKTSKFQAISENDSFYCQFSDVGIVGAILLTFSSACSWRQSWPER